VRSEALGGGGLPATPSSLPAAGGVRRARESACSTRKTNLKTKIRWIHFWIGRCMTTEGSSAALLHSEIQPTDSSSLNRSVVHFAEKDIIGERNKNSLQDPDNDDNRPLFGLDLRKRIEVLCR
jgi:hypothetical protein